MTLVRDLEIPRPLAAGWNSLPLDLEGLPAGLYFIRPWLLRGGERRPGPVARLVYLP